MGVALDKNLVLEFPSGSMFWGRSAALRPLLDLKLTFEDFPEEDGRVDGTLAHAIERSVLISAEAAHLEWLKVQRRVDCAFPATLLPARRTEDLARIALRCSGPASVPWTTICRPLPFRCVKRRRCAPTPPATSGPVSISSSTPSIRIRSMAASPRRCASLPFGRTPSAMGSTAASSSSTRPWSATPTAPFPTMPRFPYAPTLDEDRRVIVDATIRRGGAVDLRGKDLFVATAWWTEGMARAMNADRKRFFGKSAPFVYIIQDDEPYFSPWGSRFVLRARELLHARR